MPLYSGAEPGIQSKMGSFWTQTLIDIIQKNAKSQYT